MENEREQVLLFGGAGHGPDEVGEQRAGQDENAAEQVED